MWSLRLCRVNWYSRLRPKRPGFIAGGGLASGRMADQYCLRRYSNGGSSVEACCAKHRSWLSRGALRSQELFGQRGDLLASKKTLTKRLNGSRTKQYTLVPSKYGFHAAGTSHC